MFHADLHIHSKFSRACSKDCDIEHLSWWALRKGLRVLGTGDFTHPAWAAELRETLVPAEPGLFRIRPDLEKRLFRDTPASCAGTVRFMLSVEISTIYRRSSGRLRGCRRDNSDQGLWSWNLCKSLYLLPLLGGTTTELGGPTPLPSLLNASGVHSTTVERSRAVRPGVRLFRLPPVAVRVPGAVSAVRAVRVGDTGHGWFQFPGY